MIRNSPSRYGAVAILLHWLIALGVIGEFALGLYMVDLDFHDPDYYELPHIHESVGILLTLAIILRIIWSLINIKPDAGTGVAPWEHIVSRLVHIAMSALLVAIVVFGYLLSTAEGDGIEVFNWFELPPVITSINDQESLSIFWHYWLAWTVICFAFLHAAGAIKHHVIDKDETLRRMLGLGVKSRS